MLKKIKGLNKYKYVLLYSLGLIFLLFFVVILLNDKASNSLYFVSITCGMCSLVIGENNSLSIKNLGFGITRKETEYNLIKELLLLSLNTIILIGIDILFIFIIYKKIEVSISFVILSFLLSLLLCLLIVFIKMNCKNKLLLLIPLGIILALVGILFIKNKIIIDIIIFLMIILLYFLNRYNIYNKKVF